MIRSWDPKAKQERDEKIFRNVSSFLMFQAKEGDAILSFSADPWEPDLRGLERVHPQLRFYYPKVRDNQRLEFLYPSSWHVGAYGLKEPSAGEKMESVLGFRWILLPGLGYSREGVRLGRGMGYYDRALELCPRERILGICYQDLAEMEFLSENHDLRVERVLSEDGFIGF